MCTPSVTSQVYTGPFQGGAPCSKASNTWIESTQAAATPAMASSAATVRPIRRPARPAMIAAASGAKGMASSRFWFMISRAAY